MNKLFLQEFLLCETHDVYTMRQGFQNMMIITTRVSLKTKTMMRRRRRRRKRRKRRRRVRRTV